jgi:hypothetical protein
MTNFYSPVIPVPRVEVWVNVAMGVRPLIAIET